MNTQSTSQPSALQHILAGLGFDTALQDEDQVAAAYRLEFEKNFEVELQGLKQHTCRVSARIFNLGKSLQVQEKQISSALLVFGELLEEMPPGISPVISDHDNCLRLCIEVQGQDSELLIKQFHEFVHLAFAFQQTCFKQG